MIQALVQYSLDKDHLRHSWRLQKKWMSYQGHQDAQDKQLVQYPLLRRSKWECSKIFENSKIGMSRHMGSVSHDTNGMVSSMEDPVVLLERNLYGHLFAGLLWERQFEKILLKHGWEKVTNCECFSLTERKDYSCLCMWTISILLERNWTLIRCGKYSWKTLIWEYWHDSLTPFIWFALKENAKPAKKSWTITGACLNPESLLL